MNGKNEVNPWFSIWIAPEKTIDKVLEKRSTLFLFYLSSIWFLQIFFTLMSYYEIKFPIHYTVSILIAIFLSPLIGYLGFYVFSFFLDLTGKWLKGKSDKNELIFAFAWSRIPVIIDLIMWFVLSFFLSELVFSRKGVSSTVYFINLVALITFIWSSVLLIACVKKLQKFSYLKAFLNVLFTYFLILSLVLIFVIIIYNVI